MHSAESKGLFTQLQSNNLTRKVPSSLKNNFWIGITKRARILFYNPNFLSQEDIKNISYENLSDKKWQASIAVRQANNIYNQSLVASILEHNGIEKTKKWLKGIVR